MHQTLVAYGTRRGATAKSATVIAEILKDKYTYDVELINVKNIKKQKFDLSNYENIIVGSSITMGRWTKEVKNFLKRNNFTNKKIAVFVSAGGTFKRTLENGQTKSDAVTSAVIKYIDKTMQKFHISPIAKSAFGGNTKKYDNWNHDDVEHWAMELGKIL